MLVAVIRRNMLCIPKINKTEWFWKWFISTISVAFDRVDHTIHNESFFLLIFFFYIILALWPPLNTNFVFTVLLSAFAVSFSSYSTKFLSSHHLPRTIFFNPILTIQDRSSFLLLHVNHSQSYRPAPWLCYKTLATHFQLPARHHYLHVLRFL